MKDKAIVNERDSRNVFNKTLRFAVKTLRFYGNGLNPFHGKATVWVSRETGKIVSKDHPSSAGQSGDH